MRSQPAKGTGNFYFVPVALGTPKKSRTVNKDVTFLEWIDVNAFASKPFLSEALFIFFLRGDGEAI